MAISSDHVIKSVSKKLKYYVDVKRLEDGFDLSGVGCPRLDHPPTKARPTLMYGGLHDRPLKHYFSPQEVKAALTQFKSEPEPQGKNSREKEIRRQLDRYFRRYNFNESTTTKKETKSLSTSTPTLAPSAPTSAHHRKARPVRSAKAARGRSQPSVLADAYYTQTKHSKKLKPEASGGFGVGLKKRRGQFRGGQPVLRSAPPTSISRHETERLVNIASRLLVATETIDLKNLPTGKYGGAREKDGGAREKDEMRGAPRGFETSSGRRRNTIYTYDINGRRIMLRRKESEDDSAYHSPTPSNNYVTISGQPADDQVMPRWLREEVGRGGAGADEGRPQSAQGVRTPRPPSEDPRPHSAAAPSYPSSRPRTSSENAPYPPAKVKNGWGRDSPTSPRAVDSGASTTEMAVQTGGELLKDYEPSERILWDGERMQYEVSVVTGNRLGASTKADVKIVLIGDKGRTQELYLQNSATHKIKFQKGNEDVFSLDTFYVGPIRKIAIGHDRNELGFGWYLTKVDVRDMTRRIQYNFSCERWLSSKESDRRTFREFIVDYSTDFTDRDFPPRAPRGPPQQISPPSPTPDIAPAQSSETHSDTTSHTSMATVYSDRSQESTPRAKRTPPRRPSYTSQSSDYTTSASTTPSSTPSSSASPQPKPRPQGTTSDQGPKARPDRSSPASTPRKEKAPEEKKKEEPKTIRPKPIMKPLQRRDTFFDQQTAGHDYSSVIDTLSQTTEGDRRDSQDFEPLKPGYESRDPTGKPLALIKDEDEETSRLAEADVADPAADRAEEERVGARLSMPAPKPPTPEVTREVYLDGFKAGVQAANSKTTTVAAPESDTESEQEDEDQGPTIHEAVKKGDLTRVKKIIDKTSAKKDQVDERGWAPIHIAAAGGHTDIIKWLAVNSADLNVETPTSYTAMHLAAMHGHTNTMMVLFAMGAKLTSRTVEHQTALHVASMGGHLESVKWLVANRAPLDTADSLGRLPVNLAEEYGHGDVAAFLQSCTQEQERPNSGLALIRTNSKQSLGDKSYTSYSTDSTLSDSDSDNEAQPWRNDRPTTSMGRRTPEVDSDSKKDAKHDEELMRMTSEEPRRLSRRDSYFLEKKSLYDEQQKKMSEKNVSFLDAIRDELDQ